MLQFESTITALNPAHPTTLSEILTADSWSANNHSALLFFQIVYIVSLSNTDRQISGNATTASVHPVTVDESDSGPTAANYDAYQHLHTHTHTLMNIHSQHGKHTQCLHGAARVCKAKANLALVCIIIYTNANHAAEKWLIDISPHYERSPFYFLDWITSF